MSSDDVSAKDPGAVAEADCEAGRDVGRAKGNVKIIGLGRDLGIRDCVGSSQACDTRHVGATLERSGSIRPACRMPFRRGHAARVL